MQINQAVPTALGHWQEGGLTGGDCELLALALDDGLEQPVEIGGDETQLAVAALAERQQRLVGLSGLVRDFGRSEDGRELPAHHFPSTHMAAILQQGDGSVRGVTSTLSILLKRSVAGARLARLRK